MYTAPDVAGLITTAVVTRFANENGIEPQHLLTDPDALTVGEAFTAWSALPEVAGVTEVTE